MSSLLVPWPPMLIDCWLLAGFRILFAPTVAIECCTCSVGDARTPAHTAIKEMWKIICSRGRFRLSLGNLLIWSICKAMLWSLSCDPFFKVDAAMLLFCYPFCLCVCVHQVSWSLGVLSVSFVNLDNLRVWYAHYFFSYADGNSLSGTLPPQMGSLTNLLYLYDPLFARS